MLGVILADLQEADSVCLSIDDNISIVERLIKRLFIGLLPGIISISVDIFIINVCP